MKYKLVKYNLCEKKDKINIEGGRILKVLEYHEYRESQIGVYYVITCLVEFYD